MATVKLALPVALLLCGLVVMGYSMQSAEAKPGREIIRERKLQNMATIKLGLPVALLLCVMVIDYSIQSTEAKDDGRGACIMNCLNATYMTCPPKRTERLQPACSCCLAQKRGCIIHLSNGVVEKCR
ncbi:hypothetical protein BAE44_0007811 [Dichanthelium oligosanthes]|uniref:Uncharacterized protein n=1 Tax=Dichanthelium oligosanthes TaxID=888268 RepID=A0A1E5W186_9POAL|nr:hypothetical protein BAE44_0007811 [Dichanthelium oligosanthes]